MIPLDQITLLAPDEGLAPEPPHFRQVYDLLRDVATLSVVTDFLRERKLVHSAGSWEEMELKRLRPQIAEGKLTMDDLKMLLAEAEEHGSSHIFLYETTKAKAAELLDETRVRGIVKEQGWSAALGIGQILDRPEVPSLGSIRLETDNRGTALVIKIVQKRLEKKYLGLSQDGNRIRKEWEVTPVRAVSVVRLFSFGLLEVRTRAHWYSTKYEDDVAALRDLVSPLIPRQHFSEYSLHKAKTALWEQRKELRDKIRFSSHCIRTDVGGRLAANGGDEDGDMLDDAGVAAGLDAAMKKGTGAYCESSNVYWLAQPDGALPSRETHMLLSGQRNEFAITAGSSKRDYEWVFNQLRALA